MILTNGSYMQVLPHLTELHETYLIRKSDRPDKEYRLADISAGSRYNEFGYSIMSSKVISQALSSFGLIARLPSVSDRCWLRLVPLRDFGVKS